MTALLTLSHGSRHQSAEPAVRRLTRAAGEELGVPAIASHLEFSAPDLTVAAAQLAREGVTDAIVVPLLFTRAFHAKKDVPAAIEAATAATGLNLRLATGLGTGADITEVLSDRLRDDAPAGAHVVLYSVGSSDMAANQDVIDLAQSVGVATGHSIEVIPATGGPGSGGAGFIEAAVHHEQLHLLPLFVADGLLLEKITTQFERIAAVTGTRISASRPLGSVLAGVVAKRYRAQHHRQEAAALVPSH